MKSIVVFAVGLMLLASAWAQNQKNSDKTTTQSSSLAKTLEAKDRKSWEDYKNRNKKSFAASLADGFAEVTDGADSIFSKDTELAEMDHFKLDQYVLHNFNVRPLGGSAALVTYSAEYSGSYDNSPINMKTVYGEVWVKSGNNWKQLWVQETKVK